MTKKNTFATRLVSLLAVLGVLATILLPTFTQTANAQTDPSDQSTGTTVHIHKLQADSFNNNNQPVPNINGSAIDDITTLGTNVRGLNGVTFTAYPVSPETDVNSFNPETDVLQGHEHSSGITIGPTQTVDGQDGVAVWNAPASGTYIVVESGRPAEVSSSIAVPFKIQFPMANSQGETLKEVHIYPKNLTADLPSIHKAVDFLAGTSKDYDIGSEFSWFLKSTIPTNINQYEKFEFKDTLDPALTYHGIQVVVGNQTLVSGSDYTVTAPNPGDQGGNITVSLTETGRNKIHGWINGNSPTLTPIAATNLSDASTNEASKAFIEVEVKTSINSQAVMGKEIQNQFTLTYDNTPNRSDDAKDPLTSNTPTVKTGGKRFVKTNSDDEKLEGAEFELYRYDYTIGENKLMTWTEALIAANPNQASGKNAGDPIVLKSGTEGIFEIKGLAYEYPEDEKNMTAEYYLKEIKAPAGYVALQGDITFNVNDTSYNKNPASISSDEADADPQKIVNNQRPTIPATGGIGSIIFIVLGLALIAVAYYGYQKSKADA